MGTGLAALYRYIDVIYRTGNAVHPDAMINTSSAAPQFGYISDAIRIYDAWNDADWERRAETVTAAAPGELIDGDGWQTSPANVVDHTVASTVFGIPALYYGAEWKGGTDVSPTLAKDLTDIVRLAPNKGRGVAFRVTGEDWAYEVDGEITAQTFANHTGLWVRMPEVNGSNIDGTVIVTRAGRFQLPHPDCESCSFIVRDQQGRPIVGHVGSTVTVDLKPFTPYTEVDEPVEHTTG